MEATLAKPATPVQSKVAEPVPHWKQWLQKALIHRKITKGSAYQGFCECCGAMPIEPNGRWHAYSIQYPDPYPNMVLNQLGIYFGRFQDADTLVKHVKLENAVTFEIHDGKDTHTLAWKDE